MSDTIDATGCRRAAGLVARRFMWAALVAPSQSCQAFWKLWRPSCQFASALAPTYAQSFITFNAAIRAIARRGLCRFRTSPPPGITPGARASQAGSCPKVIGSISEALCGAAATPGVCRSRSLHRLSVFSVSPASLNTARSTFRELLSNLADAYADSQSHGDRCVILARSPECVMFRTDSGPSLCTGLVGWNNLQVIERPVTENVWRRASFDEQVATGPVKRGVR